MSNLPSINNKSVSNITGIAINCDLSNFKHVEVIKIEGAKATISLHPTEGLSFSYDRGEQVITRGTN